MRLNFRNLTSFLISVALALLIATLFFLLLFQSMPQYLDYDQGWYLENINSSLSPYGFLLFNPHHLHLEIGGKIFQQFMVANLASAGFTDVTFNMRLRSLLAACLALVFLFFFLKGLTKSNVWAALGTLLVAVTHGFLMYAGKVDTGIFPVTGLFMVLWLFRHVDRPQGPRLHEALLLALFFFINVLFHQFMAILCVLAVFLLVLPESLFHAAAPLAPFLLSGSRTKNPASSAPRLGLRFSKIILMSVCGVVLIAATYFYIGRLYYNLPFADETAGTAPVSVGRFPFEKYTFQKWLFFYQSGERPWGKGIGDTEIQIPFYSFTKGMLSATGAKYLRAVERDEAWRIKFDYNLKDFFAPRSFVFNLAAVFSLVTLAGCVFFFPALLARFRRSFLLCLLSFISFSLFAVFWEAAYVEFWIVPVCLSSALGVMVFKLIEERLTLVISRVSWLVVRPLLAVLVIGFFSHNMLYSVIPYSLKPHVEDVLRWPEYAEKYQRYFSQAIYKNPAEPYRDIWKVGDLRSPYVEQAPEKKSDEESGDGSLYLETGAVDPAYENTKDR